MKDDKLTAEQTPFQIAQAKSKKEFFDTLGKKGNPHDRGVAHDSGFLAGVQWKEEQVTEQRRKDFEAGRETCDHNDEAFEKHSCFEDYLKSI